MIGTKSPPKKEKEEEKENCSLDKVQMAPVAN